jgi:cyclopropane fatty-acyl-phospholipid synthase-like methyltransferase
MDLAKMFYEVLKPQNVLDFGCGAGFMMGYFCHMIPTHGVDGSSSVLEVSHVSNMIDIRDFRKPFDLGRTWDLVISIEVAEHIEEEYANVFIDNLTKHGDRILMTSAPVGQGGTSHVNCQPKEYWIQKMQDRGFIFNEKITTSIAKKSWDIISENRCPIHYLVNNFSYYTREIV